MNEKIISFTFISLSQCKSGGRFTGSPIFSAVYVERRVSFLVTPQCLLACSGVQRGEPLGAVGPGHPPEGYGYGT